VGGFGSFAGTKEQRTGPKKVDRFGSKKQESFDTIFES
jgi:hypothetical protein